MQGAKEDILNQIRRRQSQIHLHRENLINRQIVNKRQLTDFRNIYFQYTKEIIIIQITLLEFTQRCRR